MTTPPPRVTITRLLRSVALPVAGLAVVAWVDFLTRREGDDKSLEKLVHAGYVLLGCALAYRLFCVVVLDGFVSGVKGLRVPNILKHILAMVVAAVAIAVSANLLFSGAVAGFLTLSSVIGIVVGLALRPIILDVFSGISANLDTAFRIGDWVEINFRNGSGGVTGWVEEINWRTTRVRTRSGNLIICPNSAVGTAVITNFTQPGPLSRFEVPVTVPQEVEIGRVIEVLRLAVESVVDDQGGPSPAKAPDVILSEIDDGVVKLLVRFWADPTRESVDGPRHRVIESVLRHLRLAGIPLAGIPLAGSLVVQRGEKPLIEPRSKEGGVEILSRIAVFSGLRPESLSRLAEECLIRGFQAGERLVEQGGTDSDLFVITSGAVEVLVRAGDGETRVARMTAGDWFGEMALLTGEPRTATVRALTAGTVYQVSRAALAPLIEEDTAMMELLSRNIASRNLEREAKMKAAGEKPAAVERVHLAAQILERIRAVFRG